MRLRTLVALIALSSACDDNTSPRDPTITGRIVDTRLAVGATGRPTIHVKATNDEACGIIFSIPENTTVRQRRSDGSSEVVAWENLFVGDNVSVWGGPVMESCPAQSHAITIEILSVNPSPLVASVVVSPASASVAPSGTTELAVSTNVWWSSFTWYSADPQIANVQPMNDAGTRANVVAGSQTGDVSICARVSEALLGCATIRVE